ncbi:MAG: dockerin type I repeat-containing protein, partial [candidate division Zixibacteria bacterium]|nr:dockerin type I repeat-containing protein [candidate division Zixibacteria bacterium]
GYVSLDVTQDGRAVLGGHNNQGSGYQPHIYWDFGPGFGFFGMNRRVPDTTLAAGTAQDPNDSLKSAIWPSIRYHETPGKADPVTHVFTQVSEPGAGDAQAIIYFRKVGENDTGEWDFPPYVPDTVFDIAQDVACSEVTGKVALTWIANRPDDGDCDTCSSQSGQNFVQWDNDIYYQISNNYGAPGSWLPRVNLTQNQDGVDGHRPYTDLQSLITSDEDLHIVWGARFWPADANSGGQAGLLRGRVFHWGENLGFVKATGNIRTAANLEWDQTTCNGGAWQLNGSKMNVSECDGKLYVLWTQFNDVVNGIEEDCHNRAFGAGGDAFGSANGDLYMAVSDDGGLTWDIPRNLTNTRTPHCDSATGAVGECRSEHWSSMNRHGTNLGGDMSSAEVVDPTGSYTGAYFLDVQYIGDPDPGGIVQDEGTWQQADVRWFRLPCVEPVPTSCWCPSGWTGIDYPEYTKHGTQYDKPLTVENFGNVPANFETQLNEDPGPYSGWLSVSPSLESGTINSGANNTISGTVTINEGGTINAPGTIVNLTGNMTVTGNMNGSPYVFPINFFIVDTIVPPVFDTITTGCFSLVVSNMGNWGNQGAGHVNLDFFDFGDCDDLEAAEDTIPGDATVYAYDASPVICWPDGDSVICNWSIFGTTYISDEGFVPVGHLASVPFFRGMSCDSIPESLFIDDTYFSEFTTHDTGILIEKWWVHPDQSASQGSNFIIQILRITVLDSTTHTDLNIGEAIDWDIPADTASRNRSGFEAGERLVYLQGSEYNEDPEECQENSDRYGGIELLRTMEIDGVDTTESSDPYGAWSGSNALWVYPAGGFIPEQLDSLMTAREGYVLSDSLDADLHSVMTFKSGYTLTPTTTLWVFKCLITSRLGFAAFIASAQECHDYFDEYVPKPTCSCCVGIRGDLNGDGRIDISDLVWLVDWMFTGGPPPPCLEQADVNADGVIDISDLVWLVDFMFTGGPPPIPCP